ncbi:hypothetical protein L6452_41933 [Arctium lappa]|uniref:Uncharacterized protein n=1 Tax=Arctium lappa TaxID=4217 RepID=A0ACB8XGV9_ARCLA|nr:hypothetical protein L6452_41933 [Arctium lappa]
MLPGWIETDEISKIQHLHLFVCQLIGTLIGLFMSDICCKWWEARRTRMHLSSVLHGSAACGGGVNAHPSRGGGADARTNANATQTSTQSPAACGGGADVHPPRGGGANAHTNANATQTWTQMSTLTWTQPHMQTRTQPQMFASLMMMQVQTFSVGV